MQQLIEFLSLSDPNVRFVVLGMVLLGASSGIVGSFTFLRKRALVGDAIAHSVLPGVCLAFMLWGTKNPLVLLVGATATGWLSLLAIDFITARSRIKSDAAIGLVLSVFFGVGIMLLTSIQKSGNATQSGLDKFLFGKAASMVGSDLYTFAALSVLLIVVVLLFFKEFRLISFDMPFAQAIGLPVRRLEVVLSTITVLAVAVGIQAVGVVLMAAMLITPATAARFWTDRLDVMVLLAAVFGALAGIFGAYVSYLAPSMPTGPWVVVVLSLIAFVSLLFAPQKGYVARRYMRWQHQQKIQDENVLKIFYHLGEKDQVFLQKRSLTDLQKQRQMPSPIIKKGLQRLTKKGWLTTAKDTWQLTDLGEKKAKRLVRIHRLWEVYLTQHLRIAADHVHNDAEAMEHIITPELERQLEKILNYPKKDPHDSEIPY